MVAVNSLFQSQLLTQFGSASATSQIKFTCGPGFALNPMANNSEFNLGTSGSGYITLLPCTASSQQFIIQTSVFVSGVSFQYCLECSPGFYSEGYTVNASRTPREQFPASCKPCAVGQTTAIGPGARSALQCTTSCSAGKFVEDHKRILRVRVAV